jgi:lipopolysaccharide/colanic/teichoic acid biosynthesis glycosyltransferase
MDALALKRLRTAWEMVSSYALLVSAGLLLRTDSRPLLIISLVLLWLILFAVSYLWGSYDLELGPAYGINLRTQAVFASTLILAFILGRTLFPRFALFPRSLLPHFGPPAGTSGGIGTEGNLPYLAFWFLLYLYLNILSPLLGLVAGKLARVPSLCVMPALGDRELRTFSYWGYRCRACIPRSELEAWLRSRSDERNRIQDCEAVLLPLRDPADQELALSLSRLYFTDFIGVRSLSLWSYLRGRHSRYIHFMPLASFDRRLKRVVDLVISAVVFVVLSPLLLISAVAIKLDSPGPVFFKHRRLGKDMRYFWLLKFRTMYSDAEKRLQEILAADPALHEEFRKTFKLKNDPRITRVGRFLRRASVDELPQLFNIFKDQMSWVGPRPIVDGELPFYKSCNFLPFRVTPGATGLWQISGRNETSYDKRVKLDIEYVTTWSYWRDFRILAGTVPAVLSRRGAY